MNNIITVRNSNNIQNVKANESSVLTISFSSTSMCVNREFDFTKMGYEQKLSQTLREVVKVDVLPKQFFQVFANSKQQAENLLKDICAKTDFGFIGSKSAGLSLLDELKKIKEAWYSEKKKALLSLDRVRANHIKFLEKDLARPVLSKSGQVVRLGKSEEDIAVIIAAVVKSQPTREQIESRLRFDYYGMPIILEEVGFDPETYAAQVNMVVALRDSAMGTLVKEVSASAKSLYDLMIKNEITAKSSDEIRIHGRSIKAIHKLKTKLYELSFLHPHIQTVHDVLGTVLNDMPSVNEAVRGQDYLNFKTLLFALKSQVEIMGHLQAGTPLIQFSTGSTQTSQPVLELETEVEAEAEVKAEVEIDVLIEEISTKTVPDSSTDEDDSFFNFG